MMIKAFYCYAINGFETNKKNSAIVDIFYGRDKLPLHIFKKDANKFVKAIITPMEREERGIYRLDGDEVEVLNRYLKGRAMILCTDFCNYVEYCNGLQNGIQVIVGLSIDGSIDLTESFNYKKLRPRYATDF